MEQRDSPKSHNPQHSHRELGESWDNLGCNTHHSHIVSHCQLLTLCQYRIICDFGAFVYIKASLAFCRTNQEVFSPSPSPSSSSTNQSPRPVADYQQFSTHVYIQVKSSHQVTLIKTGYQQKFKSTLTFSPYQVINLLSQLHNSCASNDCAIYHLHKDRCAQALRYLSLQHTDNGRLINNHNVSPMGRGILTFPTRAAHCPGCWNDFQIICLKVDAAVLGAIACTHIHTSMSSRCIVPSSS